MINIVKTEPWHINMVNPRDAFGGDKGVVDRLKKMIGFGHVDSYSVGSNGDILGVIGVAHLWFGVAEVFAYLDKNVDCYPIGFSRAVKEFLDNGIMELDLQRVQVNVRCGQPKVERFIEFLGFRKETTMTKFGPEGDDYYLYARVD